MCRFSYPWLGWRYWQLRQSRACRWADRECRRLCRASLAIPFEDKSWLVKYDLFYYVFYIPYCILIAYSSGSGSTVWICRMRASVLFTVSQISSLHPSNRKGKVGTLRDINRPPTLIQSVSAWPASIPIMAPWEQIWIVLVSAYGVSVVGFELTHCGGHTQSVAS